MLGIPFAVIGNATPSGDSSSRASRSYVSGSCAKKNAQEIETVFELLPTAMSTSHIAMYSQYCVVLLQSAAYYSIPHPKDACAAYATPCPSAYEIITICRDVVVLYAYGQRDLTRKRTSK